MENTKKQLGLFFDMVKVPNWQPRLETKSKDFIFEMGIFILTPAFDNESVQDVREQLNFMLNYESIEEAVIALKNIRQNKAPGEIMSQFMEMIKGRFKGANITVIDMTKTDKGINDEEYKKRIDRAKQVPSSNKISELLHIAQKLGKDLNGTKYFDRLCDLSTLNPDWLNECYVMINSIMEDDHYKQCGCVSKKYENLIFSENEQEARNVWFD